MSEKVTFYTVHDAARANIGRFATTAPHGWSCTFSPPKKRRIQEEKYHAMIGDISKQCKFMGVMRDLESWKRLLIESFVHIMRETAKAQGKPDPFPAGASVLPSLDHQRVVQLGAQSREFTIDQAVQFIEYLFSYGAENSVIWKEADRVPAYADCRVIG